MAVRERIRPNRKPTQPAKLPAPHNNNLKHFKKGNPGRPRGAANKALKVFREQVAEGINAAGNFLLKKAEIEEAIEIEKLIKKGEDPEALYNVAKYMRLKAGGLPGYIAWAALQEPAAFATLIARLFPYNLMVKEGNEPGEVQYQEQHDQPQGEYHDKDQQMDDAIAQSFTLKELEQELMTRGFPIGKMIDITPPKPIHKAEDPNPMVPQGKTTPVPGGVGSEDDEE